MHGIFNRRGRIHGAFDDRQIRRDELAQTLVFGLGSLFGVAQNLTRDGEQVGGARRAGFQQRVRLDESAIVLEDGGDLIPHAPVLGGELGIARHGFPQLLFFLPLHVHHLLVLEAGKETVIALVAVLLAEQRIAGHARRFARCRAVHFRGANARPELPEPQRVAIVAREFEFGHRQQTAGRTGIARHEDQVAFLHAFLAPLEVARGTNQLAVFVNAEQRKVQTVARVGVVVRIASEGRDVSFRREHQADVGVLLVLVEVILSTGVERDHIAGVAGGCRAVLFDARHGVLARTVGLRAAHAGGRGGLHLRGHVVDLQQDTHFRIRAGFLFGRSGGIEAVAEVIVLSGAEFLDAISAHVMIGEQQAIGRHKRSRAVRDADRRRAQRIQKLVGDFVVVALLHQILGETVQ